MNKRDFLRTLGGGLSLALLPRTLFAAAATPGALPELRLIAAWRSLHELGRDGASRGAKAMQWTRMSKPSLQCLPSSSKQASIWPSSATSSGSTILLP